VDGTAVVDEDRDGVVPAQALDPRVADAGRQVVAGDG
jgi:hypothetical protein